MRTVIQEYVVHYFLQNTMTAENRKCHWNIDHCACGGEKCVVASENDDGDPRVAKAERYEEAHRARTSDEDGLFCSLLYLRVQIQIPKTCAYFWSHFDLHMFLSGLRVGCMDVIGRRYRTSSS